MVNLMVPATDTHYIRITTTTKFALSPKLGPLSLANIQLSKLIMQSKQIHESHRQRRVK